MPELSQAQSAPSSAAGTATTAEAVSWPATTMTGRGPEPGLFRQRRQERAQPGPGQDHFRQDAGRDAQRLEQRAWTNGAPGRRKTACWWHR